MKYNTQLFSIAGNEDNLPPNHLFYFILNIFDAIKNN